MKWHGATDWFWMKQILNVCLWRRIPYCLYEQPKLTFWSCRTLITRETPTNQIPHVHNRWRIRRISRQGRSCMCWAEKKSWTVFATSGHALSCWKIAPGMLWTGLLLKQENEIPWLFPDHFKKKKLFNTLAIFDTVGTLSKLYYLKVQKYFNYR